MLTLIADFYSQKADENDIEQENLKPKLLQGKRFSVRHLRMKCSSRFLRLFHVFAGELVAITVKNVVLHTSLESKKQLDNGVCGLLVLTNFKLSFVSNESDKVN